ncbi:MAG TPA: DUF222 domain-containing protein, partial [Aeromicrobium sp.]|nr:DUF222 domain-containing protein [Aeromicrobium sp.]
MISGAIDQEQAIGLLRDAAQAIRSVTASPCDRARALVAARNAIDAQLADELAEIDATKAHEVEGAASVATWARRELRQDPATTRQMVRAAKTMRVLPKIGAAAHAGSVSIDQVHALTYGLKHVGHEETVEVEEELLTVTEHQSPTELFALMRRCKAIAHPDELDEAWLRGMDKADLDCHALPDGFHVTGFLPTDVGAKLKAFLASASVPRDGEDTRSSAERRLDAFDELLTTALGDALPSTNTVSAHLSVIVEAETLKNALAGQIARSSQPELLEREPATLEGFGPIGPALLAYLAFGGELTPILVAGFTENRAVLDVGRSQRLATKAQRKAIHLRQAGRCANRGCHHPIGEIHHVTDWVRGGTTNLDNLAGLCRKCHALVTI